MKKILIITYYWPPAGGGGVQRWLKFAKYLPENGITPIVAIPDDPEYPITDTSLKGDINNNIEEIRIPIWEPYKLFKAFTSKKADEKVNTGILNSKKKKSLTEKISIWLRGNILIPDARVFWVRPTVKQLKRYLKDNPVDTIITTGPPHSVHLIGDKLKKKLKLNWIADFRDPWSEIDYLEEFNLGKLAKAIHKKLERKVLLKSDRVITVSHNWAKDLKRLGAPEVSVITNGYDEADFKTFNYHSEPDKFILLYSGMLHEYRNPVFLWDELERLCSKNHDFADKFHLSFFGTIDDAVFKYLDKLQFLSKRFSFGGYISHNDLLKEYEQASMLLLIQNETKNALGHIPGKVFEYLATQKAILAIGPTKESDIFGILQKTNSGKVFNSQDPDLLSAYISDKFSKRESNFMLNSDTIQEYSRNYLTKELVKILNCLG